LLLLDIGRGSGRQDARGFFGKYGTILVGIVNLDFFVPEISWGLLGFAIGGRIIGKGCCGIAGHRQEVIDGRPMIARNSHPIEGSSPKSVRGLIYIEEKYRG
jgi:hypothetical protein